MITYHRSDRYSWRRHARRLIWRINYALAFCSLALLLLVQPAYAAPRCPGGGQPDQQGRCAYAPAPPDAVCGWPLRTQPTNGRVAVCSRQAAQPAR